MYLAVNQRKNVSLSFSLGFDCAQPDREKSTYLAFGSKRRRVGIENYIPYQKNSDSQYIPHYCRELELTNFYSNELKLN